MAIFRTEYKFGGKIAVLRNAEPDDAQALLALARRLEGQAVSLRRDAGELGETETAARAFLLSRRDPPNARFAVAEIAGRIVAACDAFFPAGDGRHAGEMALAVDTAHWDIGVARALLEEAVAWFRKSGVEKVTLGVDTQNVRAITLCHHLGFVVEGRQERARKTPDGAFRDAYWLGLKL